MATENLENPTLETGSEAESEEVVTEVPVEEVPEEGLEFATTDELIEKYKKTVKTNKQLHARAVKAEAQLKRPAEKKEQNTQTNTSQKLSVEDRVELRLSGYTPEEVSLIEKLGGMEALKDETTVAAIEGVRAKKKSQEATPQDSPKSPVYKKYTREQLAGMTLEQLEKIVPRSDD